MDRYGAASGSEQLQISVVIPTRDREASVVAVVEALLADDVADSEVLVVDDGSRDGTWAALQRLAARDPRVVPLTAGAGKRAADVVGTTRARGRVLVFLDDDVMPQPGLLRGHLEAHRDRDDLVVLGYMPTVVPRPATGAAFATILYASEYEGRCAVYDADPADVLQHLWAGNMSMTRAAYDRARLAELASFDFRHEDRETGLACAAAGLVGVFDRSLMATHRHTRTVDQFLRDSRREGGGRAELAARRPGQAHAGAAEMAAGLPAPVAAVVRACRRPVVGRPAVAVLTLALRLAARSARPEPAVTVAKLLRRVVQQAGMLEQMARTGAGAAPAEAPAEGSTAPRAAA